MGDMAEGFREMKESGQIKRASNRKDSAIYLKEHDVSFAVKNYGAHLIIEGPRCLIDFWPGTGKWMTRDKIKGFGVRNLVTYCNKLRESTHMQDQ